jgi:hypothetical protein
MSNKNFILLFPSMHERVKNPNNNNAAFLPFLFSELYALYQVNYL